MNIMDFKRCSKRAQIILTLALLFINIAINGQNLLFVGDKSFEATKAYTLSNDSEEGKLYGRDVTISFADSDSKGGYVILTYSADVNRGDFAIGNQLIIYLDNGESIKCYDRGMVDMVDQKGITVYQLTEDEIDLLKTSNINTVRYQLRCYKCEAPDERGSYTVVNKEKIQTTFKLYGGNSSNKIERIDFPTLVERFFH